MQLPRVILKIRLSEIASFLGLPYVGNDVILDGFNLTNRNIEADGVISYCASVKYFRKAQKNSKVKALIVPQNLYDTLSDEDRNAFSYIISDTAEWSFYRAYINVVNNFDFSINYKTVIPDDCVIQEGAIVEKGVELGHHVVIGNNSVIKAGTIICDNVTIGCCSIIGGEGFQLIKDENGNNHLIPHIGRTYLADNVSVGDNTVITKSLFEGYTKVLENAKIDNFVHVSHNCTVGQNSVVTAHTSLFGSSIIGENVWIAPHCSIMNRVHVGNGAFICGCSFVCVDVKPDTRVSGNPATRVLEY